MIEPKRPMCLYLVFRSKAWANSLDPLEGYGETTIDPSRFDWLMPEPGETIDPTWTACDAWWTKEVPLEDRPKHTKFSDRHVVKCMEPAAYYVSLDHGGINNTNNFCEYHKPRIKESS